MGKGSRTRKKAGRTASWNLPLGEVAGWRWAGGQCVVTAGPRATKLSAVGSISRQERIIFHPLVSVGNISLKNTPDFSCSCGITHFRHVPFSNSHLLHFRKFLSFSPSPFSPSPSPLRPPSHSVFLSFSLSFFQYSI